MWRSSVPGMSSVCGDIYEIDDVIMCLHTQDYIIFHIKWNLVYLATAYPAKRITRYKISGSLLGLSKVAFKFQNKPKCPVLGEGVFGVRRE